MIEITCSECNKPVLKVAWIQTLDYDVAITCRDCYESRMGKKLEPLEIPPGHGIKVKSVD